MTTIEVGRADCPHQEKGAFPSKVDAEQAILGIWRKRQGGPLLRVYLCQCGMWHLTKKEDDLDGPSRDFERLVNEDLRNRFGKGHAYAVLSRPENLVGWLQVLTGIRLSIISQNTYDNAMLRAHPDRPTGGVAPNSYLEAKKGVEERKRGREPVLQAVAERVGRVRRLIGAEPVSRQTAGTIAQWIVEVDALLRGGEIDDARAKLARLLQILTEPGEGA